MRKAELERAGGRGAGFRNASGPGGGRLGKDRSGGNTGESTLGAPCDEAPRSGLDTQRRKAHGPIAARATRSREAKGCARANRKRLQGVQRQLGYARSLADAIV